MPLEAEFRETDAPVTRPVAPAELRALRRARKVLKVEAGPGGTVVVGPRPGYVGSLRLPTGGVIRVLPKVSVGAPTALLALAYRTMAHPEPAGASEFAQTDPSDWLLLQLAAELERLLARGLRRGYVDRREHLSFVRGRVRPPMDPARLPFIDCEFSDFTLDTPLNRLLRSALELISRSAPTGRLKRRLLDVTHRLAEVSLVPVEPGAFDRLKLDALSAHYAPAMSLCRLALEGAGLDRSGTHVAPSFFVPMWRVWEAALANALRDAGARVHEQAGFPDRITHVHGAPSPTVTLRPDLLIGSRARPRLVIDAKWTPVVEMRRGSNRLINAHLYQLATYSKALGCDGVLVYPQGTLAADTTYDFDGCRLRVLTVDLGDTTLAGLAAAASLLASQARGL